MSKSSEPSDTIFIKLVMVSVGYSDGSGKLSTSEKYAALKTLNGYYKQAKIQFIPYMVDGVSLNSDDYAVLTKQEDTPPAITSVNKFLNWLFNQDIYHLLISSWIIEQNAMFVFFIPDMYVNGKAFRPGTISMVRNDRANTSTFAHEIGHNLNLIHTHGEENIFGYQVQELVNGSNCNTAGDELCDTNAEPYNKGSGIDGKVINCIYTGAEKDPNGAFFVPNVDNIMSYSQRNCRFKFTPGQIERMWGAVSSVESIKKSVVSRSYLPVANKKENSEDLLNGTLALRLLDKFGNKVSDNTLNSGDSYSVYSGLKYEMVTNNQSIENRAHKNWNKIDTLYHLKEQTIFSNVGTSVEARFFSPSPITVIHKIDGIISQLPNSTLLRDPWFSENGNQPNLYKSVYGTYNTFLNEFPRVDIPNKPFYGIKAVGNVNNGEAFFLNWSTTGASIQDITKSEEQSVVFATNNAIVSANYKGHLRTGAPEKADQKNQRRSDGFLTVYESMGEIWLTQVDGYGNWSPEIRLSFGTGTAKNPSLSNWVPVYSGSKAIISWLENGQVFFQPVRYSNSGGPVSFSWDNQSGVREYNSRPGLSTDSRPVATLYLSGSGLDVWYAYEANTGGIESGRIVLADSYSSPFMSGLYRTLSGFVSGTTKISTGAGDQYPVLINQPAASGFAAKKAIYFLAGGYAAGKRIAEYNLANEVTTVFPVNNSEYTFTSLSGGVNPTSASYTLVAAAQRNLSGGVISYDTEIYQKASYYSVTSLPSLSKIYSNATNPVVMVDNTPYIGSPVYEVNFKQGTNWYKANGGSALTLIGTNIAGIFSSEQVGSGTRKSVVVKTNTSPASLVFYSGTGVLNKGEGTLYADVRSVRNYVTLNGQSKTAILDFAGALVEPVDSLENGSSICAVKLIAPDQNTIIVRQPDSIKTALAIDLIRNGVSVRSYSASLWDELSINSFEDVQDGDVLVFRLGFPVASSWGYEIYDFNGTSLTKNEEEAADAVKLKKLENGVLVYPNPFNPNTRISVSLEAPASVKVMVFNILGQLVSDFGKADLGAGVHTYAFDGKSLASGTYFYRVEIGEKVKTGKLQLLK